MPVPLAIIRRRDLEMLVKAAYLYRYVGEARGFDIIVTYCFAQCGEQEFINHSLSQEEVNREFQRYLALGCDPTGYFHGYARNLIRHARLIVAEQRPYEYWRITGLIETLRLGI